MGCYDKDSNLGEFAFKTEGKVLIEPLGYQFTARTINRPTPYPP